MELSRCAQCLNEAPPQWLTIGEVANLLRVSKMTVYRLIEQGQLRSVRFGRQIRVHVTAFDNYVKAMEMAG